MTLKPAYLYADPGSRTRWHHVELTPHLRMIDHPVGCDSLNCPVAREVDEKIPFPPPLTGTYPCAIDDQGQLLILNAVPSRPTYPNA